jgi:hypothetical protein
LSIGIVLLLFGFSLLGYKYFVVRYLLPAAYFLYILLAAWLARTRWHTAYLWLAVYILGLAAIVHQAAPHGWNDFKADLAKYDQNVFYVLNPLDYVIAKYYLGPDRLILYNADEPSYRPTDWAAIGDSLQSTEQADEPSSNQNAITISYSRLDQEASRPTTLKNQQFRLVTSYNSLYLFR